MGRGTLGGAKLTVDVGDPRYAGGLSLVSVSRTRYGIPDAGQDMSPDTPDPEA